MFKYMSIRSKLLLLMLIVGLLSAAAVGMLSYNNAKTSLTATIYDQITALRETKKRQTENYFKDQFIAFDVFSNQQQVGEALEVFSQNFHVATAPPSSSIEGLKQFYQTDYLAKLKANSDGEPVLTTFFPQSESAQTRQIQFISENPAETGSKENLVRPNLAGSSQIDSNPYAKAHAKYHPLFVRMLRKNTLICYTGIECVQFGTTLKSDRILMRTYSAVKRAYESMAANSNHCEIDGYLRQKMCSTI